MSASPRMLRDRASGIACLARARQLQAKPDVRRLIHGGHILASKASESLSDSDTWSSGRTCMFERLPQGPRWADKQHWKTKDGKCFHNPWKSFNPNAGSKWEALKIAVVHPPKIPVPVNIHEHYKVVKPQWHDFQRDAVRATWIGHATFILELPKTSPDQPRGLRILFDPVFSEYTSPSWAAAVGLGPKRYSKLPCTVDELPEIDIVCISHNHYDHLDVNTVRTLEAKTSKTMRYICGRNNRKHFVKFGVLPENVHEMDWGDNTRVTIEALGASVDMACCPSQHTSARTLADTDKSLWCSWMITTPSSAHSTSKKVYFAGDTGYCYTPTDDRKNHPRCPVFEEIGERFNGIDLAMIPIGLYSPRAFMSNVHCCPEDSVDLHIDIKSKKSVAMHYATFRGGLSRNFEDVLEPPRRLKQYATSKGLAHDEFVCIDIGGFVEV